MAPLRTKGRILERGIAVALALATASAASALVPVDCPTTRARAEIDAVGSAMVAWLTDLTSGVAASEASPARGSGGSCSASPPVDVTDIPPINSFVLALLIVPDYIDAVPIADPWGHPYEYRLDVAEPLSADVIAVRSAGADGVFEGTTYDVRATSGPEDDLVFYDDFWIRDVPRLDPVSRQQVTLARMRQVGAAVLEWYQDVVSAFASVARAPLGAERPEGWDPLDLADYSPIASADLAATLSTPLLYSRCVPDLDAWGTPFDYRLNDDLLGSHIAAIRSLGSDATAEGDVYPAGTFPADERHNDLVWADGLLIREPDSSGLDLFLDDFESGALWGYWSCAPEF